MRFLFLILLWIITTPAFAADLYGLAMHGDAKYGPADTHLTYANPDAPKGGTLHQSDTGTFDTLNPLTIKGNAAARLGLTTDRLMARVWDEPFTMYPMIAKSYDIAEDRSWISFTLNPKARFHDGSPITIDDVVYSFETLKEFGRPNMRRIYRLVSDVKTTDNSITFTFGEGYDQETALILAMMPVLSKSYWSDKTFDATTLDPPLSSGPYRIAETDPGRRIVYERVPDYWAKDLLPNKGLHNFDRIIIDYYRDDGVAFESFKSGAINIFREWNIARWASGYDFPAVQNGEVTLDTIAHKRPERAKGLIFNTRRTPFDDIRVREALSLLLDDVWINKNLFYDQYKRINSFYPNSELAARNDEPAQQSRRQKMHTANQLLNEAGWIVENGQRMKDGQTFTFEILLGAPEDEKIAINFRRALEKMGISPTIRVLDTAAYRGRLNEYDFDMTLYYWNNSLSPGTEQMLYYSCDAGKQPARWNFPGICAPEIDRLASAIANATSRKDLVTATKELDQRLIDGHYMIPLFYSGADHFAYWRPIKRPEETPIYGAVLETWWMDEQAD